MIPLNRSSAVQDRIKVKKGKAGDANQQEVQEHEEALNEEIGFIREA